MSFMTFRRYYLDEILNSQKFKGKVLDVGGKKDNKRGTFTPPLKDVTSWEYLNIDENTNPDYHCSADNIPIKDESFDVILLAEVLEHLEKPTDVLRECKRILKKNGKLIATMPFLFPIHADPYDFQRWTEYKLRREFENAGFSNITICSMGSIFAVIYDLLYVALGETSKKNRSIRNRAIKKVIFPVLRKVFLFLDKKYAYKSKIMTTGYHIEVIKEHQEKDIYDESTGKQ